MGLPEIADRGRQELRKRLERVSLSVGLIDPSAGVLDELAPTAEMEPVRARAGSGDLRGAATMLFDGWSAKLPARFFDGARSATMVSFSNAVMAAACDRLLAAAESIRRSRFDLLGYHALSFGEPPDWHLDPVSGRRAPLEHWSRLDPLDRGRVGDCKVIWELNRHQWLVSLGQGYRLVRDERYAETFAESVRSWQKANPVGLGINWASSLEVSLRLIAWCWALALFQGSRALSTELFVTMLGGIAAHARHVERHLSHYFSPNTHLTGEALGLFYAGVVFPELRSAPRWRALGAQILVAESERQVLADGVHFERSTCYQRYTAEIYLHFSLLAARNGLVVPAAVTERLERMLDFLLAVRLPDGSMPQIGDGDGGCLLPLAPRAPHDLRGLFATAAVACRRPDYAGAAGGPAPEAVWLLGPSSVNTIEADVARTPARPLSTAFPDGGYVVMRSGWADRSHQLVFDVGPLGCPVTSGHGHADLLSVQCAAFGRPYVVDPGTFCYTAAPEWRDFFRSSAAHSTVMIDGRSQAVPRGPFAWQSRPAARLSRWVTTSTLDVADAEHDAYGGLSDPVTHRRRVLWVKPRYWLIVDDLTGTGQHEVELRFQFAPMDVTMTPDLWARALGCHGGGLARGGGLLIKPFTLVGLAGEVKTGEEEPIQGWVSEDYGQRRAAPALVYGVVTGLPLRIATLLLPIEDPAAPPPAVSLLLGERLEPTALSFDDGRETVRFGEREEVIDTHG
jgi:heparinase II/III-like protein